jgi:hypothetical protein
MLSAVDEYVAENSRAHNCSYRDVVAVIYMHALVCHACVHTFILNSLISDSTVIWYNCALSLNIRCHRPLHDSVMPLGLTFCLLCHVLGPSNIFSTPYSISRNFRYMSYACLHLPLFQVKKRKQK